MALQENNTLFIAILGAESSGKSRLTAELADHYHADAVYEYAREYMSSAEVDYSQLEHIASTQMARENEMMLNSKASYIFFDTEIINLQVWFEVAYNRMPEWLESLKCKKRYDFYLVTQNDLTWVPDELRMYESLEFRDELKNRYIEAIRCSHTPWDIVEGTGSDRLHNAIEIIDNFSGQKALDL